MTYDLFVGAIPALVYLFRPSVATSAPAAVGEQDHFFYSQVRDWGNIMRKKDVFPLNKSLCAVA